MTNYYLKSGGGTPNSGTYRGVWQANTAFAVGDRVSTTAGYATTGARRYMYRCTTGGTSGASQPTWVYTTPGSSTTADNGVIWRCENPITWANAHITLDRGVNTFLATDDNVYISHQHAEVVTDRDVSLAVTANPSWFTVVDDTSGEPPITVGTGASWTVTGTGNDLTVGVSDYARFTGLTLSGEGLIKLTDATYLLATRASLGVLFWDCAFTLANASATTAIQQEAGVQWVNCDLSFGYEGDQIQGNLLWEGGSVLSTSIEPSGTWLVAPYPNELNARGMAPIHQIRAVDLTHFGTAFTLGALKSRVYYDRCTFASGWAGSYFPSGNGLTDQVEAVHCLWGTTAIPYRAAFYCGTIDTERTLVRTGGASDGAGYSLKAVSNTNVLYPRRPLVLPEIMVWNSSTGASKTVTVEILRDSATDLTDVEIWLEVFALTTSGVPLAALTSDRGAPLGAGTAQTDSSATWTTTGMSNPNPQKLSVTVTPQEVGPLIARVCLAKASATVYVDPLVTIA